MSTSLLRITPLAKIVVVDMECCGLRMTTELTPESACSIAYDLINAATHAKAGGISIPHATLSSPPGDSTEGHR